MRFLRDVDGSSDRHGLETILALSARQSVQLEHSFNPCGVLITIPLRQCLHLEQLRFWMCLSEAVQKVCRRSVELVQALSKARPSHAWHEGRLGT